MTAKSNAPARRAITLDDLRVRRDEIIALVAKHKASNVRVFGSVARGEAAPDSDLDLLVRFDEGATVWNAVALWRELRTLIGRDVDVIGYGQCIERRTTIMSKTARTYLLGMLEYIGRAELFAADGRTVFENDLRTQMALIRAYEIIGEIAKRLPKALLDTQPHIE